MKKKIIDLLKSGKFTLAYHDREYCTLYKGIHDYDDLTDDYGESSIKEEINFYGHGEGHGYAPEEVVALVKALGGKVVST